METKLVECLSILSRPTLIVIVKLLLHMDSQLRSGFVYNRLPLIDLTSGLEMNRWLREIGCENSGFRLADTRL